MNSQMQEAIYSALSGSAALVAALGGDRIYTNVSDDVPYVMTGDNSLVELTDQCGTVGEFESRVYVWTRFRDIGISQVTSLMDLTIEALRGLSTVPGHRLVSSEFRASSVEKFPEDDRAQGIIVFRFLVEGEE